MLRDSKPNSKSTKYADMMSMPDIDDVVLENNQMVQHQPRAMQVHRRTTDGELGISELVQVAQQLPTRDRTRLVDEARRIGRQLSEDGFYSWPSGGNRIEGPSIKLMQSLVPLWGCMQVDVRLEELDGRKVRIIARVVDFRSLTINTFPYTTTISEPPGKFAKRFDQRVRWETMQEGSAVSKSIRNCLERALPAWFYRPAVNAAMKAAQERAMGGMRLEEAVDHCCEAFRQIAVDVPMLEELIGTEKPMWVDLDIMRLRSVYGDINTGRATVQSVFGSSEPAKTPARKKVTDRIRETITAKTAPAAPVPEPPAPEAPAQLDLTSPSVGHQSLHPREERLSVLSAMGKRPLQQEFKRVFGRSTKRGATDQELINDIVNEEFGGGVPTVEEPAPAPTEDLREASMERLRSLYYDEFGGWPPASYSNDDMVDEILTKRAKGG